MGVQSWDERTPPNEAVPKGDTLHSTQDENACIM